MQLTWHWIRNLITLLMWTRYDLLRVLHYRSICQRSMYALANQVEGPNLIKLRSNAKIVKFINNNKTFFFYLFIHIARLSIFSCCRKLWKTNPSELPLRAYLYDDHITIILRMLQIARGEQTAEHSRLGNALLFSPVIDLRRNSPPIVYMNVLARHDNQYASHMLYRVFYLMFCYISTLTPVDKMLPYNYCFASRVLLLVRIIVDLHDWQRQNSKQKQRRPL